MSRRWITMVVAALAVLTTLLPSAARASESPASETPIALTYGAPIRYEDVAPDHWAFFPILKLREAGILSVDESGQFRPDDPVSRAELIKMVLGARQIDTQADCLGLFTDVACSAWYAPYAETAYRMGIAEGQGGGQFGPNEPVSRQELVTIIVRALGQRISSTKLSRGEVDNSLRAFTDSAQIADWAKPAAAIAVSEGLTSGYDDGSFRPAVVASRAQTAVIISQLLLASDIQTVTVDGKEIAYREAYTMTASMYATGEPGVGTITYTGLRVRPGTVAVDPRVIPLGSLLYVENYGYAIAADIGGAIKGNRIDLFTTSYNEAITFGMQTRRVWLLP